jgi:NAD(P)H-flavin reductase/ferredoxin
MCEGACKGTCTSAPRITFVSDDGESRLVRLCPGESVLDGLLRNNVGVHNSCRAGICQSCLLQATEGAAAVPADAQRGLKESMRARGMFLACACRPTPGSQLTVQLPAGAGARVAATVKEVEAIGRDVARVRIACDGPFDYFPGQFVNVVRPDDGLTRSYSLASLQADDALELHVRRIPGGRMSGWLHDEAKPGDTVELAGPLGDCFYVPGRPEQPMLLIGTGTGLAPLYAIARDAIRQGHTGPIRLYHGALDASGLYFAEQIERLAAKHADFRYVPCVLNGPAGGKVCVGAIDKVVLSDVPNLAGWRVFLCGDPTLVNMLRKRVYLAGAAMKDINADAFVMRASA